MAQKTYSAIPSGYSSSNSSYSSISTSYPINNAYADSSSSTYAYITCNTGSRATTYVSLTFNVSEIPNGATIDSVSCKAKVRVSSTSYISTAEAQMYSNTTAKGSATTARNTTATTYTISNTGSWTRSELNNIQLRYTGTRGTSNTTRAAYLYIYGADLTITYTYEEVKYTITTSASNCDINPSGTTQVVQGEDFILDITSDNEFTVTDNNVDVTSKVTKKSNEASYLVETAQGATYGFATNSDGYYESANKGKATSCALCVVRFNLPVQCTVTFSVINYAEATYDYGLLSNVDTTLSTSASADTTNVYWNGKNNNSSSVQTVAYTIPSGEHYIYVKYFKDSYTDSNYDTLQFKVAITPNQALSSGNNVYEYVLKNVGEAHVIVVTGKSGEKLMIKVNNTWTEVKEVYKKINGVWIKQDNLSSLFDANINYVKAN